MKKFNWEEFKDINNKIAVHCKTEEEAKDFCKQMHEHGMMWCSGDSYLEKTNFHWYKDKTCYYGAEGYADLDYALRNEHAILEWGDYMTKEFTKANLKDGMVVETRNGERGLFLKGNILYTDGWNPIGYYTEDLIMDKNGISDLKNFDIMKVYNIKIGEVLELNDIFNIENLTLIWKRENKRMTVEEMRQKLEELLEERIEVVNDDIALKFAELSRYCDKQPDCSECVFNEKCPLKSPNDEKFIKECYEKVMEEKSKK